MRLIDGRAIEGIARHVFIEARNIVIETLGAGEWNRLSMAEKASICREAARGLDDIERLEALLSDETEPESPVRP